MDSISVFKQIASDLNIEQYNNESDSLYNARIIYSAMGMWIRMLASTLGDDSTSASKATVYRKANAILEHFICVDNGLRQWYYPSASSNPVNLIRATLLQTGDLVEDGFSAKMCCGTGNVIPINSNSKILIGSCDLSQIDQARGLANIMLSPNQGDKTDILEYMHIPECDVQERIRGYEENAKWVKLDEMGAYEVFDPSKKAVLSSCWSTNLDLKPEDLYVCRRQMTFGAFEYQLLRFDGKKHYISMISQYCRHETVRDTQRLLFALKAARGSKAVVTVEEYKDYFLCHFWSKLPPAEDCIMRYIGWPYADIENKRNEFVIPHENMNIVNRIANNLGIALEVH